jgi:hypothetical protein
MYSKNYAANLLAYMTKFHYFQKKNPNDALNKFKLKFINKLVSDSNEFLTNKYRPLDDFLQFEEDDIPQNGDVVFILSQYLQCFEKFRSDNVAMRNGTWCWSLDPEPGEITEGGKIFIRTVKPKRLKD